MLPQLRPFFIYTDGSWSLTGASHSYVTGNDLTYLGSAGLTIISDLPNWKESPILTLNGTNGQDLGSIYAYNLEVLGLLVGLSIAAHFP